MKTKFLVRQMTLLTKSVLVDLLTIRGAAYNMIPMPAQGNIIILIGHFQNIARFVEVGGLETIKDIEKNMLDF